MTKFLIVSVFCFSFAYLFLSIRQFYGLLDEGLILYNAKLMLAGKVLYRDFWTVYPPGQFFLTVLLFKIFETSAFVVRIFDLLVRSGLVAMIFYILSERVSRNLALLGSVVVLIIINPQDSLGNNFANGLIIVLLLSLFSLVSLFRYYRCDGKRYLFICGFLLGLVETMRTDMGFYAFFAVFFVLGTHSFIKTKKFGKEFFTLMGVFLFGVVIPVSVEIFYLLMNVSINDLLNDLVIYPLTIYPEVRALPLFALNNRPYALYSFIFSLLIFVVWMIVWVKNLKNDDRFWEHLTLVVLGSFFLIKGITRMDEIHVMPAFVIAIMLGVILLGKFNKSSLKYNLFLYCFLVFIVPILVINLELKYVTVSHAPYDLCQSRLKSAECVIIGSDQEKAIAFIQERTKVTDKIFVGNLRHDKIVINNIMFYYLADRNSGTKYHELVPGLATSMPVQQEIVGELRSNNIKFVVLFSGFEHLQEDNETSRSTGVHLLDEYIANSYRQVEKFGGYQILQKI